MNRLHDVELFARLIGFDTVSHKSNLSAFDFVRDYLDAAGIPCHKLPNEDGSKATLLAKIGPDGSDGLLLSGHFDVVPAAEPDWKSDPFTLAEMDDRYVGRGTADMKGFVALSVNALVEFSQHPLKRSLAVVITYDEEVGTLGAKALSQLRNLPFELPKHAVIGEPTMLRAVRLHKGHLKLRVIAHGKPAHTGSPHLGVNAIERMGVVIQKLTQLTYTMREERVETSRYFAKTPFPVLSQAVIAGGTAANIVPERCIMEIGVRLLPGQSTEEMLARLRTLVAECPGCDIEIINDSPPMITPEDAPLHRTLCDMMGQTESLGVSYATDAGHLRSMGIDCILWGPGSIEDAHHANEFISKEQFSQGRQLLHELVRRWCVVDAR